MLSDDLWCWPSAAPGRDWAPRLLQPGWALAGGHVSFGMNGACSERAGPGGSSVSITASLCGHPSRIPMGPHTNEPAPGGGGCQPGVSPREQLWEHSPSPRGGYGPSPSRRWPGPAPLHGDKATSCRECRICTLESLLAQTPSRIKPPGCTRTLVLVCKAGGQAMQATVPP